MVFIAAKHPQPTRCLDLAPRRGQLVALGELGNLIRREPSEIHPDADSGCIFLEVEAAGAVRDTTAGFDVVFRNLKRQFTGRDELHDRKWGGGRFHPWFYRTPRTGRAKVSGYSGMH